MTDPAQAWRAFVAARLAPHLAALAHVLRTLVDQPYPPAMVALDFELFPDRFTDGVPARAFFMDAENSEVFVEKGGRHRGPGTVDPALLDLECIYPIEEEEAFLARPGADAISDDL